MKILVVDDQKDVIQSLCDTLDDYEVLGASSIAAAIDKLKRDADIQVIFIDVMLGNEDGLDLLKKIRLYWPRRICVMISGNSTIRKAVDAIQMGAWDFVEKPLSLQRILVLLKNAATQLRLSHIATRQIERYTLLGQSPAIREINHLIDKAAQSDLPVLITGPSGSGKEHVSHLIHLKSQRSEHGMVKLNCSSIPRDLFEAELFGAVKGSYTGAHQDRKGKMIQAHLGTLFMDEIGEMPLEQQAKLLRVLEEKQVCPLGSENLLECDFRLIAATNRDLSREVKQKNFRQDLLFRIAVIIIDIPPLSSRKEDIPVLAQTFLDELNAEAGAVTRMLSPQSLDYLQSLPLEGNVRELKNIIQRAYVMSSQEVLDIKGSGLWGDNTTVLEPGLFDEPMPYGDAKKKLERYYIERQLELHNNNISHTAQDLDLLPNNLMRKMKQLGIHKSGRNN